MIARPLTAEEIDLLTQQGCTAKSWNDIEVKDGFDPHYVRDVQFSGKIKLGVF